MCHNISMLNEGRVNMESKVKWFNNEKGFGFLENNKNEKEDIFVHYTQIIMDGYKTLKEGDHVSFNLVETPKGLQAKNVEAIKDYKVVNGGC